MSIFYEINPLLGYDGLLPVHVLFKRLKSKGIDKDMSKFPTIFWWAPEMFQYVKSVFPQLSEFDSYETILHLACLVGILLSFLILFSNKFMSFYTYFILWFLYLSIQQVGQLFFSFQWDIMLLEAGFLTIFLSPTYKDGKLIVDEIASVTRDLLKWLSFRLNYASGVVKLTSQCPTWWNLTALHYHFESQPLPNPISFYFHHLPSWLKKFFVAQNFVTLIGGSLLLYSPIRSFRIFGVFMLLSEQFMIIITGNYNFFNFLTVLVTLAALDDKFLKFCTPRFILKILGNYPNLQGSLKQKPKTDEEKEKAYYNGLFKKLKWFLSFLIFVALIIYIYIRYIPLNAIFSNGQLNFRLQDVRVHLVNNYIPIIALVASMLFTVHNLFFYSVKYSLVKQNALVSSVKRLFAFTFAFLMYFLTAYSFFAGLDKEVHQFPLNIPIVQQFSQLALPYHISNNYGLFRRMTGVNGREELIFEVSEDGINFKELSFYYKPGPVNKPLYFVAPYHPRLDWQLWFSAMKPHINDAYLINFMYKLINNKPSVFTLIEDNPLQGKEIKYLNVRKYIYSFNSIEEKETTGNIWKREKHQLLAERVMKGHNNLEENLKLMEFDLDIKKYPIHILREVIPLIQIIWASLILIFMTNYLKYRKRVD